MNKIDIPISVKRVDHGIQRISDNPVAAFHTGLLEHFPE
jgi:hypothetical protein